MPGDTAPGPAGPAFPTPRRRQRIEEIARARLRGLTVVLDNLYQSHNMSAVLRSADAFGIDTVHTIEDRNPFEINRGITRKCEKWMTLRRHDNAASCLGPLQADGFRLWAAMPSATAVPVETLPLTERMAFVFGNEGDGVAPATLDQCHGAFAIPMFGFSGSLNVSVAAAVTLYVMTRRYRAWRGEQGDLAPDEISDLARRWIERDRLRHRG